jgi:hypothetical protein
LKVQLLRASAAARYRPSGGVVEKVMDDPEDTSLLDDDCYIRRMGMASNPYTVHVLPFCPTLQQSPMADDAFRALNCLVEGDPFLFKVKTTGSMEIYELKELILEQGNYHGVLRSVNVIDLTLWKVRMTMASDNTTNFLAG